jgi:hypothetical protein
MQPGTRLYHTSNAGRGLSDLIFHEQTRSSSSNRPQYPLRQRKSSVIRCSGAHSSLGQPTQQETRIWRSEESQSMTEPLRIDEAKSAMHE